MALDTKFFILNKPEDYENGYFYNCYATDNGELISRESDHVSVYISKPYDSLKDETVWHKMILDTKLSGDSFVRVTCFASDESTFINDASNDELKIEDILYSEKYSIIEKQAIFEESAVLEYKNATNMLLNRAKGRFFWFMIEFREQSGNNFKISSIKLEFPHESFLDYLPKIFKENDSNTLFLDRFINIFQDVFIDIEKMIDDVFVSFDPLSTKKENLNWLCEIVGIDYFLELEEEIQRKLIYNSSNLYNMRGTKKGLNLLISMFTGKDSIVIEHFKIYEDLEDLDYTNRLENLYDKNIYSVTAYVNEDDITIKNTDVLRKIIDNYVPAYIDCKLIRITNKLKLGTHILLDINSRIKNPFELRLERNSKIPFRI